MDKLVRLHHGGRIVRTRDDSLEFLDMCEELLIFSETPSLTQLVERVKVKLGWNEGDVHVQFEGVIDVGSSKGPRIKRLLKITSESEWNDYKAVVLASEVRSLDLVVSKESGLGNDNFEAWPSSPAHIGYGPLPEEEILVTQLGYGGDEEENPVADGEGNHDSDEEDDDYVIGDAEEGLDDASGDFSIEDELSDEDDLSGEEDFGDARATNRFDMEIAGDDESFVEEIAEDSDDDRPVGRLNLREIEILSRVLPWRDPLVGDFEDLSHGHRAVADGGPSDTTVPDVSGCLIIRKGILFATMDELKSWLQEYSIVHNRPFRVINSFKEKRYTVACEEQQCGWRVCARKTKAGKWKITSMKQPHVCATAEAEENHLQLNSRFIARQLCPVVKHMPTITVSALVEIIFQRYNYYVKYGKAWRAKQRALEIIFGNWEEAYERLPVMLNAMRAVNPGMHFEYLPKEGETRNGSQVFGRAFWAFGQSIEAFKHCRPVVSIDGTFLTGKFEGTMLICIGTDAEDQLVPLAFAIVRKEDTDSWCWFLRLVRQVVIGLGRDVCVISDRHAGILNAVEQEIPGYGQIHHRWCTRHLAQNLIRRDHTKDNFKLFEEVCRQQEVQLFKDKLDALKLATNVDGRQFLSELMASKDKWSLAYDTGGWRWGFMTSNMAEMFNSLLRGCRGLPVTAIASFTFYKLNSWFVSRKKHARSLWTAGKAWPLLASQELAFSKKKSKRQKGSCFDPINHGYEILEGGGTNIGGEDRGARKHKVVINENKCTCGKPIIYHRPCSHMITACRLRRVDPEVPPRMAAEFSLRNLMSTWNPQFEPFLDESQWPTYDGPKYVADLGLLWKSRGPRRRKWFRMDMDRATKGRSTTSKVGRHFVEDTQKSRCSGCHKPGHNKRKCPELLRQQVSTKLAT